MMCTAVNGYAGWSVIDKATGIRIDHVVWVDPELKAFCTVDHPFRVIGGDVASTLHRCAEITVDLAAATFWIVLAPVVVAPLSPGRQHTPEPTDQPCPDCCQPQACRRNSWCAAHRCGFGERAP